MGSVAWARPHVVCIPFPTQGHINPMLKLAKILHSKLGFYITFVNTEYNHKRQLKSMGPNSLDGLPDFRFETIPDGLPPSHAYADLYELFALTESTSKNCLVPFCSLISRLNNNSSVPLVTCIVSDGIMSFTLKAAEEFGLPEVLFWPTSSCALMGFIQLPNLVERGYIPLPDMSYFTNGYLETTIDWIPGMKKDTRLRDLPCVRITNVDENKFLTSEVEGIHKATALILNTFDSLEQDVLNALSAMYSHVYSIGPLPLMADQIQDERLKSIGTSLWKEESECIEWLDSKEPKSVVYVNFGSTIVITAHQLTEFAWGLANAKKPFLWVIRPDIVAGESAILPPEFVAETAERSMLASWCPQEQVLKHPAIGCFLTHCGWNSILESMCSGVPLLCWPFFGDQQINCRYSCVEWEIGLEIDNDVKRDEVEKLVRELTDGEKATTMRNKAMEWKKKAEEAAALDGSSYKNLGIVFDKVLNFA